MDKLALKTKDGPQEKRYMKSSFQRGSAQLQNGKWTIRYLVRDPNSPKGWKHKRETLPGCKTEKQARKVLNERLTAVNTLNNNPRSMVRVITLDEFEQTTWQTYLKTTSVADSTIYSYDAMYRHHIKSRIGGKRIDQITPSDLTAFFSRLQDEEMAPKYALNIYGMLNTMFEVAKAHDLLDTIPLRRKLHRPEYKRTEKPVLTPAQIRAIVEQLPDEYKPFVFFIAVTGLRLGEARSIKWQDIDLESGKLQVSRSIWRARVKEPKTEASKRPLILPVELVNVLRYLWRQSQFNQPEHFVFCRMDGRPYDPDVIRESVLYPAMDRAGINRQHRSHGFHIFRHTAGSIVHTATGNLKLIQEFLGHSRISTTSDIYVHVPETMTGQATEIMVKEINLALSLPTEPERVN